MAPPVEWPHQWTLSKPSAVDQLQRIVGHLRDAVVDLRQRAAAGAAMIVHDHGELLGELRDIVAPESAVAAQSRHQEQRRSAAVRFVVELRAVAQLEVWHLHGSLSDSAIGAVREESAR